jgi:arabinan endo-1,5-alpha-L-arabinosidase
MKIFRRELWFAVVVACVAGWGRPAAAQNWTGGGANTLWSNPANWSPGLPGTTTTNGVYLGANSAGSESTVITIASGDVENCGTVGGNQSIYGPQWGAQLDIYGTLNLGFIIFPAQWDATPGNQSVINMYGGSAMNAVAAGNTLLLGDAWWYAAPYVTMNLYGNARANFQYLAWGGHLNLYDDSTNIFSSGVLEGGTNGYWGLAGPSDATRQINLAGGTLILPTGYGTTVSNWITRGICLVYGKSRDAGEVVINDNGANTIVAAASLGGGLQSLTIQLPNATNFLAGATQLASLLGNYPNVSNVLLNTSQPGVDPASLPGLINFSSGNPNVFTVNSNGMVTAVSYGTATLTATVGAVSGSVTVTVAPLSVVPFNNCTVQMPFYGDYYLHDPSPMIKAGGSYFIYGDGQGISGITSTDLRNWSAVGAVFPGNPPAWTTNAVPDFTGYFWAPDVAYFNGQYYMYYAASEWGTINSGIGVATSPSLSSPVWTDQGKVIQSNDSAHTTTNTDLTAYNCIDPSILIDTNGTVWMSFGSYSDGILIMQLDPATGKRISPNSPIYRVANNGPTFFSNTEEGSFLYQFGPWYYLFANWGGCCAGVNSTYNIRVGRSTNVFGPFYDRNRVDLTNSGGTVVLESSARYIGPGQAGILLDNGTYWFTYHYYDGNNNGDATVGMNRLYWTPDGWPSLTNDWSAFYPLNLDAHENLGIYNGTLVNGAGITSDPVRGNVLALNGSGQYARLPDPVANASTFAAWVKWSGGAAWQRIFDFGDGTGQYLFLTPAAADGNMRFAITVNGNQAEQIIEAPAALPTNTWCHVAVTLDGSTGVLYLDGAPVATNSNLTIRPWQTLAKTNYLGKSQFPADPGFSGSLSSFRIFSRPLAPAEIAAIAAAPPALAHRYSFSTNGPAAAWDSVGMAHGLLLGNATVANNQLQLNGTAGSYVNLPGGLLSGASALTLECWASFAANGNWAQLLDCGNINGSSGIDYLSFSPHTSLGGQALQTITSFTSTLSLTGTLDNQNVLLTCVVDPANNYAAIYTNAVLEGTYANPWPALDSVSAAYSFIGRSLFSADAWLSGTIDELRLYDGRLTPSQITADYLAGPAALASSPLLSVTPSGSNFVFAWPSTALGFVLQTTTNLVAGPWINLPQSAVLQSNQWQFALPPTNAASYYRLVGN